MLQEFRKRSASQQISKNIDQNKLEYIRSFAERLDNQDFRQTDSLLLDVQEELIRMHHKNEVLIRSALNKNIKWHFNVYGKLKETSFFLFFYASHTTPNRSDWKKTNKYFQLFRVQDYIKNGVRLKKQNNKNHWLKKTYWGATIVSKHGDYLTFNGNRPLQPSTRWSNLTNQTMYACADWVQFILNSCQRILEKNEENYK